MNTTIKTQPMSQTGNGPDKTFRAGPISATIWTNHSVVDGKQTTFSTVALERTYKDREGNWQKTNSFRLMDLPKLSLLADKAYEYVVLKGDNQGTSA